MRFLILKRMIMTICEFCGFAKIDCDCQGDKEWYSFDDCEPMIGQRCLVKIEKTFDVSYTKPVKDAYIPKAKRVDGKVTAWRPLYGQIQLELEE
jgi:hypothetical protein